MRLAYFLPIHRNARQFAWIFSAIYDPADIFVIHIDQRSPDAFRQEILALVAGRPNVHLLDSIPVAWGGWSICETEFRAIRLLAGLEGEWRYLVNLSGQDYPLRPIAAFRDFLRGRDGENFIRVRQLKDGPFHFRRRLFFRCVERDGRLIRLPIPNWPFRPLRIEAYGSQWHFLSRDFCLWLAGSGMMEKAKRSLEHVKIPDEFFMQAIILNSPFRHTLNDEQWRYNRFEGPSPVVLKEEDYETLLSSEAFFARKFDESVDRRILSRLAERIGAPEPA